MICEMLLVQNNWKKMIRFHCDLDSTFMACCCSHFNKHICQKEFRIFFSLTITFLNIQKERWTVEFDAINFLQNMSRILINKPRIGNFHVNLFTWAQEKNARIHYRRLNYECNIVWCTKNIVLLIYVWKKLYEFRIEKENKILKFCLLK